MTIEVAVVNLGGHDLAVAPSDTDTPVVLKSGQVHRMYVWKGKELRVFEAEQVEVPIAQTGADDE